MLHVWKRLENSRLLIQTAADACLVSGSLIKA